MRFCFDTSVLGLKIRLILWFCTRLRFCLSMISFTERIVSTFMCTVFTSLYCLTKFFSSVGQSLTSISLSVSTSPSLTSP